MGLKAISISGPVRVASTASDAWASSPVPASIATCPSLKRSRTGVLRSATSATRLTASTRSLVHTTDSVSELDGKIDATLGYSPSSSRVVVCRWPASNPTRPSPPAAVPRATSTEPLAPSEREMSDSVRAGMSTTWLASVAVGFQCSSRMARR